LRSVSRFDVLSPCSLLLVLTIYPICLVSYTTSPGSVMQSLQCVVKPIDTRGLEHTSETELKADRLLSASLLLVLIGFDQLLKHPIR
jgi:hypothetical protein